MTAGQATHSPKGTLSAAAYRQLKADIIAYRLPPEAVVLAAEQAERLGISRTPVHEALKALCQEGLMHVVPRVGYIVTAITASDVEDIFELRLTLEVLGAGLAAERVTARDIALLREQNEGAVENAASGSLDDSAYVESVIANNRDFHLAIADLSRNPRLTRMVAGLLDEGQRIYRLWIDYVQRQSPTPHFEDHHHNLIEALQARDPNAAREAMATHIREIRDGTLEEAARALRYPSPGPLRRPPPSPGRS